MDNETSPFINFWDKKPEEAEKMSGTEKDVKETNYQRGERLAREECKMKEAAADSIKSLLKGGSIEEALSVAGLDGVGAHHKVTGQLVDYTARTGPIENWMEAIELRKGAVSEHEVDPVVKRFMTKSDPESAVKAAKLGASKNQLHKLKRFLVRGGHINSLAELGLSVTPGEICAVTKAYNQKKKALATCLE